MKRSYVQPYLAKPAIKFKILVNLEILNQYHTKLYNKFLGLYINIIPDVPDNCMRYLIPNSLKDKFDMLYQNFIKSNEALQRCDWYINRLLNQADSLNTASKLLPESYIQLLKFVEFNGDKTSEELFDQECFSLLEEAHLNLIILGIEDEN